jgi:NAD(P)-dependent dehydrogenase (short-subunit alcohol dehydrogenase family)
VAILKPLISAASYDQKQRLARTSFPGTSGLAAVNGALEAMIPTLALELKPIRVNAVSPGIIDTPWWDAWPKEQRKAAFAQIAASTPVGRIGQQEDIAQAILFLLENSFMTGTVVECDGGIRIKYKHKGERDTFK